MQAFLGSPELKEEVLLRIKQDQNLDRILQEISLWDDKLRSMWMPILHSSTPHKIVESTLGIPEILSRLSGKIFEGLSLEESRKFPLQFIQAIPVGVSLSPVWDEFAVWLLGQAESLCCQEHVNSRKYLSNVKSLYLRRIEGGVIPMLDWTLAGTISLASAVDERDPINVAGYVAYGGCDPRAANYVAQFAARAAYSDHAYYSKMRDQLLISVKYHHGSTG